MYRCRSCHTAFVWPLPSDAELTAFYQKFHLPTVDGGQYEQVEARMEADFPAKVRLVRSGGRVTRLLDVGCGKGFFVRACREQGIAAEGIDVSETAVKFAKERLGVPAISGRIEDRADELGKFDAVTMWATIEHLPHPVETLRAIRRVLKPDGILHLDTGIGHDWLDRLLPGVVQWYDPPQHLFVFSSEGLKHALRTAGFRVVRFDPCFDRSWFRRQARIGRALLAASGMRLINALSRLATRSEGFTRFPLGNLQSISATPITSPSEA
ncbi:MAG: hypothetical protein DCC67_12015 [Planctomycetota bacterium]|nr:MAG: hypothetical protein DCC67_12015 [Planctomycetota bacterium]